MKVEMEFKNGIKAILDSDINYIKGEGDFLENLIELKENNKPITLTDKNGKLAKFEGKNIVSAKIIL
ncbi:hypothetical protein ACW7DJ_02265 [Mammaliicoccus sciuri]